MTEQPIDYDEDELHSREEMEQNIDGLLSIMREEVAFLEEIQDRIQAGDEMNEIFEEFIKESQLDDIEVYLDSL